jgi:IS5 family transposase
MQANVPWVELIDLIDLIEPKYPKTGSKGIFPPYPMKTMMRIHLMQQ